MDFGPPNAEIGRKIQLLFLALVALTGLPIGYSVIVALTGLPIPILIYHTS